MPRPRSARSRRSRCARTWRSCARKDDFRCNEGTWRGMALRYHLVAATVSVVVLATIAVLVLRAGTSTLAKAGHNLDGENVKMTYEILVTEGAAELVNVKGSGVASSDGSRARIQFRYKASG